MSALTRIPARLRGASKRTRVLVTSGLVVLLVAAAASTVVLGLLLHRAAQTEQTQAEVADVARKDVEQLLTYRAADADADRAQVLVFLRQTTSRGNLPPSTTASRATVTLTRSGDGWLISGLAPA